MDFDPSMKKKIVYIYISRVTYHIRQSRVKSNRARLMWIHLRFKTTDPDEYNYNEYRQNSLSRVNRINVLEGRQNWILLLSSYTEHEKKQLRKKNVADNKKDSKV